MIEIKCIYAKEASSVKMFLKKLKNLTVINYMDIINKLTKNDVYSNEPSDLIINAHIITLLDKLIVEKNITTIYYVMSNLNHETIYNLKEYIKTLTSDELYFSAYIKNKEFYHNVHFMFDHVHEMVN